MREIKKIIENALFSAAVNNDKFLILEHILLELLKLEEIKKLFVKTELDNVKEMEIELQNYINQEVVKFSQEEIEHMIKMYKKKITVITTSVNEIFKIYEDLEVFLNKETNVFDLFLSIIKSKETAAGMFLENFKLNIPKIKKMSTFGDDNFDHTKIIKINGKTSQEGFAAIKKELENIFKPMFPQGKVKVSKMKDFEGNEGAISKFTINMNELAKENKYDILVQRDKEIDRIIQILARKKKNNPLLLGETGVGKTAIIEGLAKRIIEGKVPKMLSDKIILSLDTNSLIAGTSFRGEFEENMKNLIEEVKENENIILFVDEFHTLFGLGNSNNGTMDATNILKPYLARGEIKIIGATTFEEAKSSIEKNKALSRRFQSLNINEPSKEDTIKILEGLKKSYEDFHKIELTKEIITTIVNLSDRYLLDRHFPDKAIDVIDEIGANRILNKKNTKVVSEKEVYEVVSLIAKTPISIESKKDKDNIINLSDILKKSVFGQEEAIEAIVDKIIMKKAGLIDKNKPTASYLFYGASGTGKTELARQLSKELSVPLFRYDMGEFSEENAVSRLFGTSAGYVGYEEGGRLIEDVKKHPYCVIVFDEIEKANIKVINSLLQILEEAEATSNDGNKVNFQHSIIIFTSNAGSKTHVDITMGFMNDKGVSKQEKELERVFSYEFRNRLDGIVQFNELTKDNILKIVDKNISEIENLLIERKLLIKLTPKVKDYLVDKGYDKNMGARPLKRVIEKEIKLPISKMIFQEDLKETTIKVNIKNDKLFLNHD